MLILFKIELLKLRSKKQNIFLWALFGFFLISFFAFALLLGYNLIPFVSLLKSNSDKIEFTNKYLFLILYLLILLKVLFQKTSYPFLKPFFLLPISKNKLILYALIRSFLNAYNIFIEFFVVGFWLKNVLGQNQVALSIIWLFMFFVFHFSLYTILFHSKVIISYYDFSKIKKTLVPNLVIALVAFSPRLFYSFQLINRTNYFLMVVLAVLCFISIILISHVVKELLYEDSFYTKREIKFGEKIGSFINDPLILLQTKLLIRNRLLRGFLFQEILAMIFVIYELQRINLDKFEKLQFIYPIFLLVFISVLTGYFMIVPYSSNIFGIESSYLPFLLTKNIKIFDYIKSKVAFIFILSLLFALFSAFLTLLFFPSLLFLLLSFTVYFTGVVSYLLIVQSIKHYYSVSPQISLFQNIYNVKNKKTYLFIAMLFPLFMFLLINWFYPNLYGNYLFSSVILALGIIGILLRKKILRFLVQLFIKNKYDFTEKL